MLKSQATLFELRGILIEALAKLNDVPEVEVIVRTASGAELEVQGDVTIGQDHIAWRIASHHLIVGFTSIDYVKIFNSTQKRKNPEWPRDIAKPGQRDV